MHPSSLTCSSRAVSTIRFSGLVLPSISASGGEVAVCPLTKRAGSCTAGLRSSSSRHGLARALWLPHLTWSAREARRTWAGESCGGDNDLR
jgi:hypothetical protein